MNNLDTTFMRLALEEAAAAAAEGEVPIGAVVTLGNQVVAHAHNRREGAHDPAGHAEFIAMQEAAAKLGRWRLTGCTVYVTVEPCLMCAGMAINARVDRVVYGAPDPKAGALTSLFEVGRDERLNHTFEVTAGVLEDECASIMKDFFKARRDRTRAEKRAVAAHELARAAARDQECLGRGEQD